MATNEELDQVITAYCGALQGARVRMLRPDGFSVCMGSGDGWDFEEWARARVEAAIVYVTTLVKRGPSMERDLKRLLRVTYWDAVEPTEVERLALALLKMALRKEVQANAIPKAVSLAA